ncbi:hypothetical protein TW73_08920 [Pseudoalteromonas piscicida]|nr:hypothetical protein TW73_08920 [Pseudoalteromonas piscicida]
MEKNGLNPSRLAKIIESLGFSITRSYMSKLTDPKSEPLNISVDKLEAIAKAFKVDPSDLLQPSLVSEDRSKKSVFNMPILIDAIYQVKSTAKEVGIDSIEFEANAIPLVYNALLNENTDSLNLELIKLARRY